MEKEIKSKYEKIKKILGLENLVVDITLNEDGYCVNVYAEVGLNRYMLDFIAVDETNKIDNVSASCICGGGDTLIEALDAMIADAINYKAHDYILTFTEWR